MVTRNFDFLTLPDASSNNSSMITQLAVEVKNTSGTKKNITISSSNQTYVRLYNHCYMQVGSGNTEPKNTDYCLESLINSLTSIASGNDSMQLRNQLSYDDENIHYITVTRTYRNDTESPITIREIGLITYVSSSYSSVEDIMIAREVIEPVVINPGEMKAFSISIDRPIPLQS